MAFYIVNILCIMLIVSVHEYGHFLFAKKCGITPSDFSVGVGPTLISFLHQGTKYALRPFLIAGYVKIPPEELEALGKWQRVQVYLAGPLANLLLCLVTILVAAVSGSMVGANHPWYVTATTGIGVTVVLFVAIIPLTLVAMFEIILHPISSLPMVAGPIGILTGSAVPDSVLYGNTLFHQALLIIYILSLSIGSFNLMPLSFLDGGRIVRTLLPNRGFVQIWDWTTGALLAGLVLYLIGGDIFKEVQILFPGH